MRGQDTREENERTPALGDRTAVEKLNTLSAHRCPEFPMDLLENVVDQIKF